MTQVLTAAQIRRRQALQGAALSGAWVLVLVLAWLLLPLLLHPEGALQVIWYAAGWLVAAAIGVVPFVVGSTYGGE